MIPREFFDSRLSEIVSDAISWGKTARAIAIVLASHSR